MSRARLLLYAVYRKLLENIVLPIGDALYGTSFIKELKWWRKIQYNTPVEIKNLESKRLKDLLSYARNKNNYYKKLDIADDPDHPYEWVKRFPILNKQTIKDNIRQIVDSESTNLVREVSSGSSGIQGEVFMTRDEQSKAQASQTLLWEWGGYKLGYPILQLGMTTKRPFVKRIKDILFRTDYQQAFNINAKEIEVVLRRVNSKKKYFGGYASGLYAYASLAESLGITDVRFESVLSWGDKMFPHFRKKIEQVFHSKVFDIYGSTEGLTIAGQCEEGNIHVLSPHVYVEFLDEKGNEVELGEPGFVVVTRLDAFAMPLIRYYLGDIAIREDPEMTCVCGRGFPLIKKIIGRDTDIVRTRSGKYLIVHFFTGIFEHFRDIRQFQVVQENLDSIDIYFIPDENLFANTTLEMVKSQIEDKLGERIIINFRKTTEIKPSASGKPQIIKSFVKHAIT